MRAPTALAATLALAACSTSSEYAFVPIDDHESPSGAFFVEEDATRSVRRESFQLGTDAQTPITDYLFVVDNSASMTAVIEKFRQGFQSLVDDDPFPDKARIAVMSTLPGSPGALDSLHPAVKKTPGLEGDPGFLRLIDHDGIVAYRKATPVRVQRRFVADGCDAWFAPHATNAAGVPCIEAHTQIAMTPVRVEAGLTAVRQLLVKHAEEGVFRPGAAVNIVFVSDTHDPGFGGDDPEVRRSLAALRPTADELRALVDETHTVASLRVHAIAPETECAEPWMHREPAYFTVATATGGTTLDICTAEDYAPFIRGIALNGDVVDRPWFPLGRPVSEVTAVQVDGRTVDYSMSRDGRVIQLQGVEVAGDARTLEVTYNYPPPEQHAAPPSVD